MGGAAGGAPLACGTDTAAVAPGVRPVGCFFFVDLEPATGFTFLAVNTACPVVALEFVTWNFGLVLEFNPVDPPLFAIKPGGSFNVTFSDDGFSFTFFFDAALRLDGLVEAAATGAKAPLLAGGSGGGAGVSESDRSDESELELSLNELLLDESSGATGGGEGGGGGGGRLGGAATGAGFSVFGFFVGDLLGAAGFAFFFVFFFPPLVALSKSESSP